MITRQQIEKCIEVAKRYGARKLVLFGGALTDNEKARDIDFLCEGVTGYELIELGADMENESSALVDLIPVEQNDRFVEVNLRRGKVVYENR